MQMWLPSSLSTRSLVNLSSALFPNLFSSLSSAFPSPSRTARHNVQSVKSVKLILKLIRNSREGLHGEWGDGRRVPGNCKSNTQTARATLQLGTVLLPLTPHCPFSLPLAPLDSAGRLHDFLSHLNVCFTFLPRHASSILLPAIVYQVP